MLHPNSITPTSERPPTPSPNPLSPPSPLSTLPPTLEQSSKAAPTPAPLTSVRETSDVHPRCSTHTPIPNPHYLGGVEELAQQGHRLGYTELLAAALAGRDPVMYTEAMCSVDAEEWHKVCKYEMAALAQEWDVGFGGHSTWSQTR